MRKNKEMQGRRHVRVGEVVDEDADALGEGGHGVVVHDTSAFPLCRRRP